MVNIITQRNIIYVWFPLLLLQQGTAKCSEHSLNRPEVTTRSAILNGQMNICYKYSKIIADYSKIFQKTLWCISRKMSAFDFEICKISLWLSEQCAVWEFIENKRLIFYAFNYVWLHLFWVCVCCKAVVWHRIWKGKREKLKVKITLEQATKAREGVEI